MTIAAGLQCSDGLILATDLEITQGQTKMAGGKGTYISRAGKCVAVVGAGYYDELAYACEIMTDGGLANGVDSIVAQLRHRMRDIYLDHIHPSYDEAGRDGALQLLVGVVAGKKRGLYVSHRSILRRAGRYAFVGIGSDLAYYLARKWPKDWKEMEDAIPSVRQLILEVEDNVPYCGKGVNIMLVKLSGDAGYWFDGE
jgi:hypothetical protein